MFYLYFWFGILLKKKLLLYLYIGVYINDIKLFLKNFLKNNFLK